MSNSLNTMVNPQLDNSLLESLTSAVLRRINIAQIASMQGRAKSVNIDAVTFEDTNVEQVNIENLSTNIKCGAAILRNVRMILELHYKVNWSYDLKWLGSNSGIKELGSKAKPIPLHDIRIPALQDIALDIPQAEIEDIDAEIQPVTNLSLGGIGFEDLAINNTNLPSDGFSLSGMGFKSFKLDTFGVPASDSEDLAISQFTPDNRVSLPTISVSGINIPSVAIDDVVSDGAVSIMDIQPEEFEAPVFKIGEYFKAYFIVTPVLHFQIGELVLSDLKASASIGSVSVERASSGIVAKGIKLDGLILNELTVNQVKV